MKRVKRSCEIADPPFSSIGLEQCTYFRRTEPTPKDKQEEKEAMDLIKAYELGIQSTSTIGSLNRQASVDDFYNHPKTYLQEITPHRPKTPRPKPPFCPAIGGKDSIIPEFDPKMRETHRAKMAEFNSRVKSSLEKELQMKEASIKAKANNPSMIHSRIRERRQELQRVRARNFHEMDDLYQKQRSSVLH